LASAEGVQTQMQAWLWWVGNTPAKDRSATKNSKPTHRPPV
jgi:hypothetical protein